MKFSLVKNGMLWGRRKPKSQGKQEVGILVANPYEDFDLSVMDGAFC